MAKKKQQSGQLPEVSGVRSGDKAALTLRASRDVREIVEEVGALYEAEGMKISKNAIYEDGVRGFWGPVLEAARKA